MLKSNLYVVVTLKFEKNRLSLKTNFLIMKFFKQISLFFLLTTAFTFVGCNDEDPDTVGPTIEITNVLDNQEFKFGDELKMDIALNDPIGVLEYQVEVYKVEFTTNSFSYEKLVKIVNFTTDFTAYHGIFIPEKSDANTPYDGGDYLIKIMAADQLGNVSTYYKPIRIVYPETQE